MKYTAKRLLTALLASVMLFSVACEKKDDKKSNNSTTTEQDIEISFAVSEDAVSDEESNEEPTKEEESYIRKLSLGYDIDEGAPILDGDVIVIQLNSTAAFAVDAGVMPSLSDFAEKGMYYSNFYAQQGADEGIYSMLTSLYAPINGYKEDAAYHSLAKLFADNGYKVYGSTVSCSDGMAKALG